MSSRMLVYLILLLGCLGCQPQKATSQIDSLHTLQIGSAIAKVEVVATPEDQRNGLMYRYELPKNEGMLFVYPNPKTMSFWMKNTIIPLSIAFIHRDGTISEIQKMDAYDGRPDINLPRYVSKEEVPLALEMNQGWFERNNIQQGDQVDLPKFLQVFFTDADIKHPQKIFTRVSQAENSASAILAKRFSDELLNQPYQEKVWVEAAVQVFNKVVVDHNFYQRQMFESVPLSEKAKLLIYSGENTPNVLLRNRALLECLFPKEIPTLTDFVVDDK